ncbi:hypothetical protein ACIOD2_49545 [Amycolatopsis sp. NPDC088138]|uniref:hypothetical protein n=1 Tax=Amycolatopsis sp. NPDC088138 TaxID=3363938 RepID=UPI00381A5447
MLGRERRSRQPRSEDPEVRRYQRLVQSAFALLGLGLLATIGYGIAVDGSAGIATFGVLVALAALTIGLLMGFIFGVPRSTQGDNKTSRGSYSVNTNLEQISDWLTKIIVGIGLVQFGAIVSNYGKLTDQLAAGLGGHSSSNAVAGVLIAFFGPLGFLLGHVITRTSLMTTFQYFDRLTTGKVAESLRELRSNLTGLNSDIVAKYRDTDAEADPTAMTVQHNREPFVPVPNLDVARIEDIVELETHIEELLGELIFPLSPRGRTPDNLIEILLRRGVLDQATARSLTDLLTSAQRVAGGAELSTEDTAAVRNSGLAVLRQLSALRRTAFAAFESHVLELLTQEASTKPDVRVVLDAVLSNGNRGYASDLSETQSPSPRVDALVEYGEKRVIVETRAQVRIGEYRHITPLTKWLYSLPAQSMVLLILLGDRLRAFEERELILPDIVNVEILMWDSDFDELWPRVSRLLRRP